MPSSGDPPDPSGAQPPARLTDPTVGPPAKAAGGWGAVNATLRHGLSEMGPVRTAKMLLKVNQDDGFDCPGCAWPDPAHRSPFEFCENGAKAVAEEATRKRVGPDFFAAHSVAELQAWSDHQLGRAGRLTHPMVLRPGATHYEPVSWEDAFARIGEHFAGLDSPDKACFYTSGRTSNEAAFLYQLMVRSLGTNNLPDCSNMCHESSGMGLGPVIGIGKGTVTLEDFEKADAIFVFGQNPGTNHPRMLTALRDAKKAGATIVSVNPLREPGLERFAHPQKVGDMLGGGVALTDLYLQVRINGDLAVLTGIMKALLEAEDAAPGTVFDRDFIAARTAGFAALEADLRAQDWSRITADSGVSEADLRAAAAIYAEAKATIICWAMGLTQHENGIANIQSVVNLLLLKGNFGRPGAGACPVRGHSNVQGDRTMGIWEAPSEAFLDRLEQGMGFSPPRHHGLAVVPAIGAMHRGEVRHFVALGGNFLSAAPDTEFTAAALRQCALTVQISTKLNRSHLVTGQEAFILPCLGRTEVDTQAGGVQFVTVENSMGVVHRSRGGLPPASPHLRSEPWIVAGLARALLPDTPFAWGEWVADYDRIRDQIEASIAGFADYNTRVRQRGGFALPNGPREGRFTTKDGLAHFTVHPLPDLALPEGRYWLMTTRTHDQYNTTIYGLDDRYRGVRGERRVVLMNPDDVQAAGLTDRDVVDLTSHHGDETRVGERFLVIPYDIPRGCLGAFFPEANVLVPLGRHAKGSLTPSSKSIVVSLAPSASGHGSAVTTEAPAQGTRWHSSISSWVVRIFRTLWVTLTDPARVVAAASDSASSPFVSPLTLLGILGALAVMFVEGFNIPAHFDADSMTVGVKSKFRLEDKKGIFLDADDHGLVTATVGAGTPHGVVEICLQSFPGDDDIGQDERSELAIPVSSAPQCGWAVGDRYGNSSLLLKTETLDPTRVDVSARDLRSGVQATTSREETEELGPATFLSISWFSRVARYAESDAFMVASSLLTALLYWLLFRKLRMPLSSHFAYQLYSSALFCFVSVLLGSVAMVVVFVTGTTDHRLLVDYQTASVALLGLWAIWSIPKVYPLKLWAVYLGLAAVWTVSLCVCLPIIFLLAVVGTLFEWGIVDLLVWSLFN